VGEIDPSEIVAATASPKEWHVMDSDTIVYGSALYDPISHEQMGWMTTDGPKSMQGGTLQKGTFGTYIHLRRLRRPGTGGPATAAVAAEAAAAAAPTGGEPKSLIQIAESGNKKASSFEVGQAAYSYHSGKLIGTVSARATAPSRSRSRTGRRRRTRARRRGGTTRPRRPRQRPPFPPGTVGSTVNVVSGDDNFNGLQGTVSRAV
jgi:hypothetical protein